MPALSATTPSLLVTACASGSALAVDYSRVVSTSIVLYRIISRASSRNSTLRRRWRLCLIDRRRKKCLDAATTLRQLLPELFECTCDMKRPDTRDRCDRIQWRLANNTCLGKPLNHRIINIDITLGSLPIDPSSLIALRALVIVHMLQEDTAQGPLPLLAG